MRPRAARRAARCAGLTRRRSYESLRHCKWVDEVVTDAPWVITPEFIEEHQVSLVGRGPRSRALTPVQIDFVCHDALPYADASGAAASGDVYAEIKKMGKFVETKRTKVGVCACVCVCARARACGDGAHR